MLFNSLSFLVFFPAVTLFYYVMPRNIRWGWLLVASYFFYMSWNPKYALLIATSTVVTFFSGVGIEKVNQSVILKKKTQVKKLIVATSFVVNISILIFFKYFGFLAENINAILKTMGLSTLYGPYDIALPVGISFYTFQALSYTVDVYREDTKAEKNIFKYALFVSFFPQLVAGPIERSYNLLKQIDTVPQNVRFESKRITYGLEMMLWGLFLKLVIADRIAILVNTVFEQYYLYRSFALTLAAFSFAIQIYCDFASYSTIAIGTARVLGFELMENFNTPYFSASIKEFWKRWHISLSTWFKDYLYIPLGGNRCGKWRKYLNIMIIFLVSGLWHGANWTFLLWGGIHGIYQIIGAELVRIKVQWNCKLHTKTDSFSYKMGQRIINFLLIDLAWIFFRSETIKDAFYYIFRIFTKVDMWSFFDGTLYTLGLDTTEIHILFIALLLLFIVDLHKYKTNQDVGIFLEKQCIWFQWGVIILEICIILIYGIYGASFEPQQFIYFQF